jgi:hypothetical protein
MPEPNKDQSHEKNCQCERHDGSWLYIRYVDDKKQTDFGSRPLKSGTKFWNSPAIFVGPLDKFGNVQAGVPTTITARIYNGGCMRAHNVYVEFWWFNPTLAFSDSLTNQLIGTFIGNIEGNSHRDVTCPKPWIPVVANSGHECLIVQFRSPSEGGDDLKYRFDASRDRHVGQHNLNVSGVSSPKPFKLSIVNPFSATAQFAIRLQTLFINLATDELKISGLRDMLVRLAGLVPANNRTFIANENFSPEVIDVTQREFGIRIIDMKKIRKGSQEKSDYSGRKTTRGEDIDHYIQSRAIAAPDFNQGTFGRVLTELTLAPGEGQEMEIEVPTVNVKNLCFIIHHFTQIVAGCDIGGYSIIIPFAGFEKIRDCCSVEERGGSSYIIQSSPF